MRVEHKLSLCEPSLSPSEWLALLTALTLYHDIVQYFLGKWFSFFILFFISFLFWCGLWSNICAKILILCDKYLFKVVYYSFIRRLQLYKTINPFGKLEIIIYYKRYYPVLITNLYMLACHFSQCQHLSVSKSRKMSSYYLEWNSILIPGVWW
jgi:hypothetical protein